MKTLLLFAFFFCAMMYSFAELPPHAYEDMKKKSRENLVVRVVDLSIDSTSEKDKSGNDILIQNVTLKSKIQTVKKTSSKRRKGNTITINYEVRNHDPKSGWVGPSQIPILEKNSLYIAYLRKVDNGTYAPSAGSHSFFEVADSEKVFKPVNSSKKK
jgi:hypothetical protein